MRSHLHEVISALVLLLFVQPATASDQDDPAARKQVLAAIQRAGEQGFMGSLLLRIETPAPAHRESDQSAGIRYERVALGAAGALRLDRYNTTDAPGTATVPDSTVVRTRVGLWRMIARQTDSPPRLEFTRDPDARMRTEFDALIGAGSPAVTDSRIDLLVRQRASEMDRWKLWVASVDGDALRAKFLSGPALPRTIQTVHWRRKGDAWLLSRIVRFQSDGQAPFSQEFSTYQLHDGSWIAHQVTEWQQPDGESRTITIADLSDTVSAERFVPPGYASDGRAAGTMVVQELTPDGWRAIQLMSPGDPSAVHAIDPMTSQQWSFQAGDTAVEPPTLRSLRSFAQSVRESLNASGD